MCEEKCIYIDLRNNLERHVGMLLPGISLLLILEELQVLANPPSGGSGLDDVIHVAADSRREGIAKLLHVLLFLFSRAFP